MEMHKSLFLTWFSRSDSFIGWRLLFAFMAPGPLIQSETKGEEPAGGYAEKASWHFDRE